MTASAPEGVMSVSTISRPPTWRATSLVLSYVMVAEEVSGGKMADIYAWAVAEGYENPRVISPYLLGWSAVFNPHFYDAVSRRGRVDTTTIQPVRACCFGGLSTADARVKFWLQSVLFLSAVTMSAAIVQSRWSAGTIASKYDKLWLAGQLSETGVVPELRDINLKARVQELASEQNMSDVERLLTVRSLFEVAIARLGHSIDTQRTTMAAAKPDALEYAGRFGFVDDLRKSIPSITAIVVYGSSVNSKSFGDYDVILVSETPDMALRALAGKSPTWNDKELNVGVYSPAELWNMQLLSGDNLADFGVCLFGEVSVPCKQIEELLARNMSFGVIRQRQQLGMIAQALVWKPSEDGDDRQSLYEYFVKIPANIVKGTFGATGNRMSKEDVQTWMQNHCDFDPLNQQRRVQSGQPGLALAESAAATGRTLRVLNDKFEIMPNIASFVHSQGGSVC